MNNIIDNYANDDELALAKIAATAAMTESDSQDGGCFVDASGQETMESQRNEAVYAGCIVGEGTTLLPDDEQRVSITIDVQESKRSAVISLIMDQFEVEIKSDFHVVIK